MSYRAFVSSTFDDLVEHRKYVIAVLREAGITVTSMEDWTADTDPPKRLSTSRVDGCDLCVLLVGLRRGTIPDGETRSITQLEYERAAGRMDVLVFLVDENGTWTPRFDERHRDTEVQSWRDYLRERHTAGSFSLAPDSVPIAGAVRDWIAQQNAGSVWRAAWLRSHARRLEAAFEANMEAAPESARARFVELEFQKRGKSGEVQLHPFSALAGTPGERWLVLGPGGSGKTTSLLRLAADSARRALEDPEAPVPLYARLVSLGTSVATFDALLDAIARKAGLDGETLRERMQRDERALLFLLDGFNEIDRDLQRESAALTALRDLLDDRRHAAIVTSRPETPVTALAGGPSGLQIAGMDELDDARIADFLTRHQAAGLNERLTDQVRELCRNPFRLWAVAKITSDRPDQALPSNQGELHREFIEDYVFAREKQAPGALMAYDYEKVKRPVLARLALDMTRRGVRCTEEVAALQHIAASLQELHAELDQLYGRGAHKKMPDPPVPAEFAAEAAQNGVLRRTGDGFEFMRESVQDCFAAMALQHLPVSAVLAEIPAARWIRREDEAVNERPTPLRDALMMLAGVMKTPADALIGGLLEKDATLAAECLGACREAGPATRDAVLSRLTDLLRSGDPIERYVGCRAVGGARIATPEILEALTAILRSGEWEALSEAAAWSARKLPAETAAQPLLDAFAASPFFFVRCLAVQTLSERSGNTFGGGGAIWLSVGSDEADEIRRTAAGLHRRRVSFEELLAIVSSDSPDRSAAALLLRLFYPEPAARELRSAIAHAEPARRSRLLDLLPMLSIGPTARATLLDAAAADQSLESAARAGESLGYLIAQIPDDGSRRETLDILWRRLGDPGMPLPARAAAAKTLAMSGSEEDRSGILRLIGDASQESSLRAAACWSFRPASALPFSWDAMLGALRFFCINDEIFEALFRATLEDPDAGVRTAAAGSLFWQPLPGDRLLEKLTNSAEPEAIRTNAAEALSVMRYTPAEPALLAIVKSAEPRDAVLALEAGLALGRMTGGRLTPDLESLLTDTEEGTVRRAAAAALWAAEPAQSLDRLAHIALDEQREPAARFRVVAALHFLRMMDETAVEKLLLVILESKDDVVRKPAAEFAYHAASEQTVDTLRRCLVDAFQPAEKREAAALGLAFIDSPNAQAALEEIAGGQRDAFAAASAGFARNVARHYGEDRNAGFLHPKVRLGMRATAHACGASWQQGLADFTELVALFPQRGIYRSWLARCLAGLERRDEAVHEAGKAAELSPDDPEVHAMLSERYVELGRFDDAYRSELRAAQLKPGEAAYHFQLAWLACAMKRATDALQHSREAVQLDPQNGQYQLQLGWDAYVAGELDESIQASQQAAALLTPQPIPSFNAGLALLAKGDIPAAHAEYERALSACGELLPVEAGASIQAASTDLERLRESRPELSSATLDLQVRLGQKMAAQA